MADKPLSEVERVNLLLDRLELDVPRAEPFTPIGQTLFPVLHALLDRIEDLERSRNALSDRVEGLERMMQS